MMRIFSPDIFYVFVVTMSIIMEFRQLLTIFTDRPPYVNRVIIVSLWRWSWNYGGMEWREEVNAVIKLCFNNMSAEFFIKKATRQAMQV